MKRIEEIRKWIEVCESAIPGSIAREIHELDAYARLLEARIMSLDPQFAALSTVSSPTNEKEGSCG